MTFPTSPKAVVVCNAGDVRGSIFEMMECRFSGHTLKVKVAMVNFTDLHQVSLAFETTPRSLFEVFVEIYWLSYQVSVVLFAKKLALHQEIFETKNTWVKQKKNLEINKSPMCCFTIEIEKQTGKSINPIPFSSNLPLKGPGHFLFQISLGRKVGAELSDEGGELWCWGLRHPRGFTAGKRRKSPMLENMKIKGKMGM